MTIHPNVKFLLCFICLIAFVAVGVSVSLFLTYSTGL
jgi:hypothetical protein